MVWKASPEELGLEAGLNLGEVQRGRRGTPGLVVKGEAAGIAMASV